MAEELKVEQLVRPITGIENRTAQEVFDIMSDRFRAALTPRSQPAPGMGEVEWKIAGSTVYTLMKSDFRRGEQLYRNRYWFQVSADASEGQGAAEHMAERLHKMLATLTGEAAPGVEREEGLPCPNCGKPVEVGQVVLPWDDAGEMHADCAHPFSLSYDRKDDEPEPVVLLGKPMRQVPLSRVQPLAPADDGLLEALEKVRGEVAATYGYEPNESVKIKLGMIDGYAARALSRHRAGKASEGETTCAKSAQVELDDPRVLALAEKLFLAEHPHAKWSAGRARAIWFLRAQAALNALAADFAISANCSSEGEGELIEALRALRVWMPPSGSSPVIDAAMAKADAILDAHRSLNEEAGR